ncbi:MAG: hypothetical protein IT514_09485 [Burkholderiales bacterium]|nr:hypothetical protein [Burkholderiales bacterium]
MTPVHSLALQPSRLLAAILLAAHAAALVCLAATLSGPPLWLAAAGVLLSAGWSAGDALLRLPGSVVRVDLADDGSGRWVERSGQAHEVAAVRASWVAAGVVVLGMRGPRRRLRWIAVFPDAAGADALRRLRVWLRWRCE